MALSQQGKDGKDMDTMSLKRYLIPIWRHFVRKMKETRGDVGATLLPDAIASDPVFKDMNTVEKLAEGFKAGQARTFADFLPDEFKADPSFTKYKTGEEFIKGHKELVSLVGKKGVTIPAEGATQEEMDKYFNSLGRPEKAEGYAFAPIEGLHSELKVTPEYEQGMKAILHKAGVSGKQADMLNNSYLTLMSAELVKRDETKTTAMQETQTALRSEWKDKYVENVNLAKRLIKVMGGDEATAAFGDLGNNPHVLKFLSKVGHKLSEDSINNIGGVNLLADAAGALKRAKEIGVQLMTMKDGDAGYQDLVKERTRLYGVAESAQ